MTDIDTTNAVYEAVRKIAENNGYKTTGVSGEADGDGLKITVTLDPTDDMPPLDRLRRGLVLGARQIKWMALAADSCHAHEAYEDESHITRETTYVFTYGDETWMTVIGEDGLNGASWVVSQPVLME